MHALAAVVYRPAWCLPMLRMTLGKTADHCSRAEDNDDERKRERKERLKESKQEKIIINCFYGDQSYHTGM